MVSPPRGTWLAQKWDSLKASFGFPAGVAMVLGLALGIGLPEIDSWLEVEVPTLDFATQEAASGLLETVATTTVAVAGIAFSVTVVAFTLTAQQLSPRVLRSFRADRLSQLVLALFLGTFVLALTVLVRLGVREDDGVPGLSITAVVLLAFLSFGLFAVFVGHIARMLQPSSVIAAILGEAKGELGGRYPQGVGADPEDEEAARAGAAAATRGPATLTIEADDEGHLTLIKGRTVIDAARGGEAIVRQLALVGSYVTPGTALAQAWCPAADDDARDHLVDAVRGAFQLGQQRSLPQDLAFSVRQLADIALKGLSPGINDPTTAENALEAMTAVLIRIAHAPPTSPIRVDADGKPRFLARPPDLDQLIRLGFDQVRVFAASDPAATASVVDLLQRIQRASEAAGAPCAEAERQLRLIRGSGGVSR